MKKYKVKVTQTFGAFAVVEAADAYAAEEIVRDLVDEGTIDVVDLKGVMACGDGDVDVTCVGRTDGKVTVSKKEWRWKTHGSERTSTTTRCANGFAAR